jgi:hypothetical protein
MSFFKKKFQKILDHGIDSCLATGVLPEIKTGYRGRNYCSSFLPAGKLTGVIKNV